MSVERITKIASLSLTVPEEDCQRLNEAQRNLLEVVLYKFQRANEVLDGRLPNCDPQDTMEEI
jgi:hypothetical protein